MKMRHLLISIFMAVSAVSMAYGQQNLPKTDAVAIHIGEKNEILPVVAYSFERDLAQEDRDNEKILKDLDRIQKQIEQKGEDPRKVTLEKFAGDSASFFVAIFGVNVAGLIVHFSDNPTALQQHLESITDPIANFSFYMFMKAAGISTDYLNKRNKNIDPLAQAQAMRIISYQSMAIGSLVSSLTADVSHTLLDCSKKVFAKDPEEKKNLVQVCQVAMKQWTRSIKAQQYAASIVSLLVSTESAQIIEMKGKQAVLSTKEMLLKTVRATEGSAFRVSYLDVALALTPGGLSVDSIKIVGKIAQFAGFTYIDHLIAPSINKAVANLWQPLNVDFDAKFFNEDVFNAKRTSWRNDATNLKLAHDLEEIKTNMTEWRQAQLTDFQTSNSIWVESLKTVIEQTNSTYAFYKTYMEELFETYNTRSRIQAGKATADAMEGINNYPFRKLPLFGVRLIKDLPEGYATVNDLYIAKPKEIEGLQLQTVRAVNAAMKEYLYSRKMEANDAKIMNEIIAALDSDVLETVGRGLAKINDVLLYDKAFLMDPELKTLLQKQRQQLGNPYPILSSGMGFSYGYEVNGFSADNMRTFKKAAGPGKWLPKTTDYLTLQMVCGSDEEVYKFPWGFAPYFAPPKIVDSNIKSARLCGSLDLKNIYDMKIETNDGKSYRGITDLITQNIRPEVIGDYRDLSKQKTFLKWWTDAVRAKLGTMYIRFDKEYSEVLQKLVENWNGHDLLSKSNQPMIQFDKSKPLNLKQNYGACYGAYKDVVLDLMNGSDYLDKNVLLNLRFESDIYLTVLNDLIVDSLLARNISDLAMKEALANSAENKNAPQSVVRIQNNSASTAAKTQQSRTTILLNSPMEPRGFLRRLKAGDRDVIPGFKTYELPEIKALRAAIQSHLANLARIQMKDGVIANFPDKAETKKSTENLENAMSIIAARCAMLFGESMTAENGKPTKVSLNTDSQRKVFEAATAGIQNVVGEITSLNLAFFATKYNLKDSYEDIMDVLKLSQNGSAAPVRTHLSPNGK